MNVPEAHESACAASIDEMLATPDAITARSWLDAIHALKRSVGIQLKLGASGDAQRAGWTSQRRTPG